MIELKIRTSKVLEEKMKRHPEINWASIASAAIEKFLKKRELNQEPITNDELEKLSEHRNLIFI